MTKATRITSEVRNGLLMVRQLFPCFRCAPQKFREHVALARNPQKIKANDSRGLSCAFTAGALFRLGNGLIVVKQGTLIGGHRAAFRALWRWKSRPVGRPAVVREVGRLIQRMRSENPTCREERIEDERSLKLQIRLSPRTVGKYINEYCSENAA